MPIPWPSDVIAVFADLPWAEHGDEWSFRLSEASKGRQFSATAERWRAEDGFFRRPISVDGEEVGVELCYLPLAGNQVAVFLLSDGSIEESLRSELVAAVEAARERMGGVRLRSCDGGLR